jgi:CheY-like chemotaxis protein
MSETRHHKRSAAPQLAVMHKCRIPMQPSAGKRPVVLVVEDEELIRLAAIDAVERAGFEVVEASNADEAIALLWRRPDIRLVFTDIHMPGSMDGLKLAHFVKGRWPPIKIIATSGRAVIGDSDLPEGGRFLHKPYTATEVTGTFRELIQEET